MNRTALIIPLLAIVVTLQAEAVDTSQTAVCTGCHGPNGQGNQALAAPRIAGQEAAYLARQLMNFKTGKRAYHADDTSGAVMRSAVAALSDADIQALAAHYSQLTADSAAASDVTSADIVRGKDIYVATCSACHGMQAQGYSQLQAPSLRILEDWYIASQLERFVNGWRGDAEKSDQPAVWMRGIASHVTEPKDLADVIRYIVSLSVSNPPP